MTYTLVYARRAARDIRKLPPEIKQRIGDTLIRYKSNPTHYGKRLVNSALGTYRFRIGDYRVIFILRIRISWYYALAIGKIFTKGKCNISTILRDIGFTLDDSSLRQRLKMR